MFVQGPVAMTQAVLAGVEIKASCISWMALQWVRGFRSGRGRSCVPSRPLSPWMSVAVSTVRQNGRAAPGMTGICGWPIACKTLKAFSVVLDNGALP